MGDARIGLLCFAIYIEGDLKFVTAPGLLQTPTMGSKDNFEAADPEEVTDDRGFVTAGDWGGRTCTRAPGRKDREDTENDQDKRPGSLQVTRDSGLMVFSFLV